MKTLISLLVLVCVATLVCAQQPANSPAKPPAQPRCCVHRLPRRAISPAPGPSTPSTTPQPATDFFVGEAKVDVTKDETVVRLAMAQHGSVLIEMPANDGPRYIIPGDPEMATVDEKALERNKRAIVVRPGSLFLVPSGTRKARTPAATVTAQMRSGLVVTFLFYPVEDLAQNVHRCVLNYNRDEVVARRRAAGLPVNLDTNQSEEGRITTGQSTAPTISVESDGSKPQTDSAKPTITIQIDPSPKTAIDEKPKPEAVASISNSSPATEAKSADINTIVKSATGDLLARAIKKPKQFKKWTKPIHGLALAAIDQGDSKESFRVVIVAVKNTTPELLKVSPGSPDLTLEMLDEKDKAVNVQSIKRLYVASSDSANAIAAGSTAYYAIAYDAPVLGVHQQLKVTVSQTAAADEPASLTLAAITR